jgi:hypothetical protein
VVVLAGCGISPTGGPTPSPGAASSTSDASEFVLQRTRSSPGKRDKALAETHLDTHLDDGTKSHALAAELATGNGAVRACA